MKTATLTIITALAAVLFAACGGPAANTGTNNANTNANTAKPTAAAPTKDALFALDKQANEAFIKGDGKFFEGFLSDKFVSYERGQTMNKTEIVKMINETKCDVKSWSLDDSQMVMIDPDTAVVTYKGTWDGTCGGEKLPSPMRAASVFVRSGDKWLGAYHAETPIIDPKAPPPPPAKAPDTKPAEKPAADVKPDALTDALMAVETKGWEAWKARDAKALEAVTTKDITWVDIMGNATANKADTMKAWTEPKCEITSVKVADGHSSSLSQTVAILTYKGTAEGTCDGQKLGALWGTTIFVKEGDAWKAAFIFESPA